MPLLRRRFASPDDVFVIQFGAWHNKLGPPGIETMKGALNKLGEDFQARAARDLSPFVHALCAERASRWQPAARRRRGALQRRAGTPQTNKYAPPLRAAQQGLVPAPHLPRVADDAR